MVMMREKDIEIEIEGLEQYDVVMFNPDLEFFYVALYADKEENSRVREVFENFEIFMRMGLIENVLPYR